MHAVCYIPHLLGPDCFHHNQYVFEPHTYSLCHPLRNLHSYTYAAVGNEYPLAELPQSPDPDIMSPSFVALPTDPTFCFPVMEFDLSKCVSRRNGVS
jgi:hypothetical protein